MECWYGGLCLVVKSSPGCISPAANNGPIFCVSVCNVVTPAAEKTATVWSHMWFGKPCKVERHKVFLNCT